MPEPPKDVRTWLDEALSDQNVRNHVGPHVWDVIRKLHAITQLLPGSGSVQSWRDADRAKEELGAGNYGNAAAHLGIGTLNAGLDWLPVGKIPAIMLGVGAAKHFPHARVQTAEAMETAGRSPREVTHETGLFRGADGQWRFEAPDVGFHVRPEVGVPDREKFFVAPLYEHYAHPVLREAYPQLANITSRLKIDPYLPGKGGQFEPHTNTITVFARDLKEAEELAIHELAHAVQRQEGFARGGRKQEFQDEGYLSKEADELYRRLAGEVEARNAESRLRMTAEERRAKPFPETEDRDRALQILRYLMSPSSYFRRCD